MSRLLLKYCRESIDFKIKSVVMKNGLVKDKIIKIQMTSTIDRYENM